MCQSKACCSLSFVKLRDFIGDKSQIREIKDLPFVVADRGVKIFSVELDTQRPDSLEHLLSYISGASSRCWCTKKSCVKHLQENILFSG